MKIIHTADWHLGQTFYGYDRSREHAVFLDWLHDTVIATQADLLLIAGDVFDSPNPSAEAQRMFYSFLTRITAANRNLQIVITAGNHDSAARLEAPNSLLDVFNTTVSGVVHYVNDAIDYARMIVPLKKGGCCLAVPYLRYNDLPEADTYGEGVAMLYGELCRIANRQGYSPIIAMGHLQASGAEMPAGETFEYAIIGGMEGIAPDFANESITYMALGHLHKEQRVARKENIRYSGAPLPMSFAERNNTQSVTQVTIEDGDCHIEKIPFDVPVKLKSIPPKPEPIEDVLKALAELPDGEIDDTSPYLEVNVLVRSVDPTLRQQIEDAVAGKAVRLVRIQSTGATADDEGARSTITYEDFKRKAPSEIVQDIYAKKCGEVMPQYLVEKLNLIIKEIENEDIGNQGI